MAHVKALSFFIVGVVTRKPQGQRTRKKDARSGWTASLDNPSLHPLQSSHFYCNTTWLF